MRSLFDPQSFYFMAGKAVKPLLLLAFLCAACAFYLGFFVAPVDATQGNSYRIIFIHVSAAWMSMLIYVLMAVFSAAAIAGRRVRILHQLTQPADHPINIYHPEGEYLKGLVLYVE